MRPHADAEPTVEHARALLSEQAPQWAELDITEAAEGWDNVMFRLGDRLALRMPRRASAVEPLKAEAQWAEEAGWGLSLPVPVPQFLGEPGEGYPYPWQVTQWFEGTVASGLSLEQRDAYAEQLAGFLVGFHRLAPLNAPENTVRGVSPARRAAAWEDALENAPAALRLEWDHSMQVALDAKPWDGPARWIHGDPHAGNLVAVPRGSEARLCAVVDLSDLTSGDPASDLGIAQAQFSAEGARRFRAAYGRGAFWADAELWDRAEGWRVYFLAMMHDDATDLGAVARQAVGLA
ncbi:phosphotransferase [Galactobacter valiniphilus]|uniref:phosphotransferase n=1 Tax=Galactobacter valiniphilus TaxID=2676122 RepID=UPI0037350FEA